MNAYFVDAGTWEDPVEGSGRNVFIVIAETRGQAMSTITNEMKFHIDVDYTGLKCRLLQRDVDGPRRIVWDGPLWLSVPDSW